MALTNEQLQKATEKGRSPDQRLPLVGGAYDNRILEQRSRLEFHYKNNEKKDLIIFIPFFENPEIREQKKANYTTYNPIGRSSSLYAYTGATSRKFSLKTTYTLPHLERFEMGVDRYKRTVEVESKEYKQSLFVNKVGSGGQLMGYGVNELYENYYDLLSQMMTGVDIEGLTDHYNKPFQKELQQNVVNNMMMAGPFMTPAAIPRIVKGVATAVGQTDDFLNDELNKLPEEVFNAVKNGHKPFMSAQRERALDTLMFFVNTLRTSVCNNSRNPLFGPPVVRIVHGTLFQSIPCIVRSYNLEWDENAGYDMETLTPRRIRLSMQLEELRTGNFGSYQPRRRIYRDNITGWETVLAQPLEAGAGGWEIGNTYGNVDPGRIF